MAQQNVLRSRPEEAGSPSPAAELLRILGMPNPLASWTMTFGENKLENVEVARKAVAAHFRDVVPALLDRTVTDETVENAKLCASEVVTDAVKNGGLTHMTVISRMGAVAVIVGSGIDENGSFPQVSENVPLDAESGRGLWITEACSDDMGFVKTDPATTPDHTAWETWYRLDIPPSPN